MTPYLMTQPRNDVDPEKYIIGVGWYTNLRTTIPFENESEFRIDPAPMPTTSILVLNAVFVAFTGAFFGVATIFGDAMAPLLVVATFGVCAMTCVAFTAIVYFSFDSARRRGPWLVFNKLTKKVTLPREGKEFTTAEVVHIQYITTKPHRPKRASKGHLASELNLVACANGERKRWPILRSGLAYYAFDHIVTPLLDSTTIPVVRIREEWAGWTVDATIREELLRDKHSQRN
jgi:hypothetical protein